MPYTRDGAKQLELGCLFALELTGPSNTCDTVQKPEFEGQTAQEHTMDPKRGPFSGPEIGLPGVSPNSWVTHQADQKRGQKTAPVYGGRFCQAKQKATNC